MYKYMRDMQQGSDFQMLYLSDAWNALDRKVGFFSLSCFLMKKIKNRPAVVVVAMQQACATDPHPWMSWPGA